MQVHHAESQHLDDAHASCAWPEGQTVLHQHGSPCAAAELELCLARKEGAVADAAVAAVAKVGLCLLLVLLLGRIAVITLVIVSNSKPELAYSGSCVSKA